ncbi:DUF2642 domain-containing protein [Caldisalinibacter kiritimatiensis]|uniref:DUF2642 domain-containing protein n=1 Tax=Caldisalinibacter kiritimatiensis TaxID=1304284 RepID=R1AUL6_9FIRM|nr:DUF2642 domain-containing protein [Caldisalinibacter kiritimatiensis]EOD00848.1 hypothetical protein L21TH_1086 [Caldisalinibacter kiritimatiensis]
MNNTYYGYQSRPNAALPGRMPMPYQVSCVDPYVVQTLMSIVGSNAVIKTSDCSIYGRINDVKPDHVVVQAHGDETFFIRIQEIVYIMPDLD